MFDFTLNKNIMPKSCILSLFKLIVKITLKKWAKNIIISGIEGILRLWYNISKAY